MPSLSLTIQVLSVFMALSQPAYASVQTAAAIGIGVGLGVCLFAAIAGFTYLKYSRRARREREEAAAAAAGPELSADEIIAMHDRTAPKGFNIWEYDHKNHLARMKQVQEGEEEAVRRREDRGVEG